MEIEGGDPLPDLKAEAEKPKVAPEPQRVPFPGPENSRSKSDPKDLAIRSSDSQEIDELIHSAPDIRQTIVDKIRGEIESGNYSVKAEKIADKIISDGILHKIE
jgi:flagellar biosynthesis anti-sigma factor FlgM